MQGSIENTTLWMGDIEGWMDEPYVRRLYATLGEPNVTVRLIRDRNANNGTGYCFIDFPTHEIASHMMTHVNGTLWPGLNKVFRLNWASGGGFTTMNTGYYGNSTDLSIWVGDLSPDVTDLVLMTFFQQRYKTVRSAKVMIDPQTTVSRGYGFIRFMDETEYHRAVTEMQGEVLCGQCIKVSPATVKRPSMTTAQPAAYLSNTNVFTNFPTAFAYWGMHEPVLGVIHALGLPDSVNEDHLREVFHESLCIKFSRYHHLREAFIFYPSREVADGVIKEIGRDITFKNVTVFITLANPQLVAAKTERSMITNVDPCTSNHLLMDKMYDELFI